MLYSRYSNPLELMRIYIDQGEFGLFVENIIDMENKRRKELHDKEEEDKLFNMYIHSMSDKSYMEWKREVLLKASYGNIKDIDKSKSLSMSSADVDNQLKKARNVLERFNMP